MAELAPAVTEQPKPVPPQESVVLPALRGDLIINKKASGRLQDLADVEKLEQSTD